MPRYKIANNKAYFDIVQKLPNVLKTYNALTEASIVRKMICTNKSHLSDVYWLHDRPKE